VKQFTNQQRFVLLGRNFPAEGNYFPSLSPRLGCAVDPCADNAKAKARAISSKIRAALATAGYSSRPRFWRSTQPSCRHDKRLLLVRHFSCVDRRPATCRGDLHHV